jgi:hypothetical protein
MARNRMVGHLWRMKERKLVENITYWNPIRLRIKGRPKNRWRDEVINDLKKLTMRKWSQIVKERKAWNDPAQRTKTYVGL